MTRRGLSSSSQTSTASLIAIKDRHLDAAKLPNRFEGFFATPDMFCDWINPVSFFQRKPLRPHN